MSKRKIGGWQLKSRKEHLERLVKTEKKVVVTFVYPNEIITNSRVQLERRDNPPENFGFYIKGTNQQISFNYVKPTGSFRFIEVDLRRYKE